MAPEFPLEDIIIFRKSIYWKLCSENAVLTCLCLSVRSLSLFRHLQQREHVDLPCHYVVVYIFQCSLSVYFLLPKSLQRAFNLFTEAKPFQTEKPNHFFIGSVSATSVIVSEQLKTLDSFCWKNLRWSQNSGGCLLGRVETCLRTCRMNPPEDRQPSL